MKNMRYFNTLFIAAWLGLFGLCQGSYAPESLQDDILRTANDWFGVIPGADHLANERLGEKASELNFGSPERVEAYMATSFGTIFWIWGLLNLFFYAGSGDIGRLGRSGGAFAKEVLTRTLAALPKRKPSEKSDTASCEDAGHRTHMGCIID